MLGKILSPLQHRFHVFFIEMIQFHATMQLQCTYRRNNDNRIRMDAGRAALDVHELLSTQISPEAGFRNNIVRKFQRHRCRND